MNSHTIAWASGDTLASFPDFTFIRDLNLHAMFDFRAGADIGTRELRMEDFFTVDPNTIRMRQDMFAELINCPMLYSRLCKSFSDLGNLFDLQKEKDGAMSAEKLLFSILEMESYVDYMEDIRGIFSEYTVKSELLRGLWHILAPLCTGEAFEQLRQEVRHQAHSIKNVRSISIGINLDSQLRPFEAGVLDIHDTCFMSGELIDRILRMDLKKDEYTCKAPLYPVIKKVTPQEMNSLRCSVHSALNKIWGAALRSWSHMVREYVIHSLYDLTPIVSEWRFVSACTNTLQKLKQKGYPLCNASFGQEDCVKGLYHPILALLHADSPGRPIVQNDLNFGADAGVYILTGPNQGGKSIYTQATGILYAMLHLGLLLPAESAVVRPVDAILTHFIDFGRVSYHHGRLSGECDRIHNINQAISSDSLFLFDEALSSTNATEAVAISSEILKAYSEIGARGIWTTHFHELCQLAKEPVSGQSRICNLTAQIDESSHTRSFHIMLGDGVAQSYATDIARKYKLSKDEIIKSASTKIVNDQ